ncbi:MAG: hypothetical protein Q9226_001256 [Calogaya cf. arnoldii]
MENEYVERNGIISVCRILPNHRVNHAEKEDRQGADLVDKDLHQAETTIRRQCERLGSIDSLCYSEVESTELSLPDGCVEVEIAAAGLNFEDIAITMGIIPGNQHLLELEGARVIRRVGTSAIQFTIGQRVLVFEKGTFGNRIIATTERTYAIPDSMSFEEASSLPSVYLTAIYSLFDLANTQKGHQETGISYEKFGIPTGNIFNSRSTTFANELMRPTNGYGVDLILNSLTRDLLDESWCCIASGGTMIELGKKDMLDRNYLSTKPFGRNASFHCFDMSRKHIADALIARFLDQLMGLIEKGQVKPIDPIKTFPFEDIRSAFKFMRGANHIGKIVI